VYHRDGSLTNQVVPLDRDGFGWLAVEFSTPEVTRVELALVNASTRYKCNRNTNLSCGGAPLDSGLKTVFRAQLIR
jgi:hypothetical protein